MHKVLKLVQKVLNPVHKVLQPMHMCIPDVNGQLNYLLPYWA